MDVSELETIFRTIWSRETSAFPDTWTKENPAHGQCLSTARIVQEYCGGAIVWTVTKLGPHFWNVLPDGREIDLTNSQFPMDFVLQKGTRRTITKEDLDAWGEIYPEIARRYSLLATQFSLQLLHEGAVGLTCQPST